MNSYDVVTISTTFNRSVKQLLLIMNESIDRNIYFDSVKRKINLVIDTDPLFLLEEGGRHLFKYRDHIKNNNFDELILNTDNIINENDREYLIQEARNNITSDTANLETIISILRNKWVSYSEQEKKIVKNIIRRLLSEYCKYLTIQR